MNYSELKKLDEETLEKLTEGSGPSDKCLCSLLYTPNEEEKKGFRASIKKAFASIGQRQKPKQKQTVYGQNSIDIPITYTKGGNGIYTTKEVIKRSSRCGKCGCDSDSFALKHSYANIRITAPDIDASSICPCPSNCFADYKDKLQSNIQVTIEHVTVVSDDVTVVSTDVTAAGSDVTSAGTGYSVCEGSRRASDADVKAEDAAKEQEDSRGEGVKGSKDQT